MRDWEVESIMVRRRSLSSWVMSRKNEEEKRNGERGGGTYDRVTVGAEEGS